MMKIEFTSNPNSADINFLTKMIDNETPNLPKVSSLAFFIRDDSNNIIAGCNCFMIYGSIYTDQLWVHPEHRKLGLGKKLIESVHDYGKSNGCTTASLTTMSFQNAISFYQKLGYNIDFEMPGYADGALRLFLSKKL